MGSSAHDLAGQWVMLEAGVPYLVFIPHAAEHTLGQAMRAGRYRYA